MTSLYSILFCCVAEEPYKMIHWAFNKKATGNALEMNHSSLLRPAGGLIDKVALSLCNKLAFASSGL